MPGSAQDLKSLYRREQREHTCYTAVFASLFVIIIYSFFIWQDQVIFPEVCGRILPTRLVPLFLSVLYIPLYFLFFRKRPQWGYLYFFVLLAEIQISVNVMVFLSFTVDLDAARRLAVIGSLTPLFIGTYLAADGIRRHLWVLLTVPFVLLLLALIFVLNVDTLHISFFSNPASMLVLAIILGLLDDKLRFREFRARKLVEEQKEQLIEGERTLKALLDQSTHINQELTETKDKLVQSEKLAAIGQLAAGVAHEINNPLGFATSNVEVLKEYLESYHRLLAEQKALEQDLASGRAVDLEGYRRRLKAVIDGNRFHVIEEDSRVLLKETMSGLERIANITKGLMIYARKSKGRTDLCDVREIVETALRFVEKKIAGGVRILRRFRDVPSVPCDQQALEQVFMNLFLNAVQAISREDGLVEVEIFEDKGHVMIKVSDNGQGIAPQHLPNIFNPFYTTKPVGQGTGLGLSIAYDIVRQHKGTIDVRSEVGKGTCFSVSLPV